MDAPIQNANPTVYTSAQATAVTLDPLDLVDTSCLLDEAIFEPIDGAEVFDHIRNLIDPEHPLTLEQLKGMPCWERQGAALTQRL